MLETLNEGCNPKPQEEVKQQSKQEANNPAKNKAKSKAGASVKPTYVKPDPRSSAASEWLSARMTS
jgi:hypothetical protein